MLKKLLVLLILLLNIYPTWAKDTPHSDNIVLNIRHSLPSEITDILPHETQNSIKINPIACGRFIQSFMGSYLNFKENKKGPNACENPLRFPQGEKDILICPQELNYKQ